MPLLREEDRKQEKMNRIVYDIETSPDYRHGIVSGNMMCKIKDGLKSTHGLVTMRNLDFKYHPDKNDDYVIPDIMVICDRKHLKGGAYSGTPKFIAETLSPSTALRDRTDKLRAYEEAGVEEYWIVSPQGKSVDIYYSNFPHRFDVLNLEKSIL